MTERRLKHWGWGYEDQAPTATQLREAGEGIRARFGFGGEVQKPVPLEEVELRKARLKVPSGFGDLFSDGHYERVFHSLGSAYRDVVRGFYGKFENPPDLVAFPRDESEIEAVLSWAEAEGAAVIPFGGGTSVCGGVEPRVGERHSVSLDLRRLDRVLEVDATSLAARIQAGATGPGLEEQLKEHGLTLRHFPQSFEYSTLGGWVATRAGGHFATLETHIDDLVESVRAITPRGTWESRRLPASGAGPSPDRMLIGSEGILGVIAEAWVRVRPRPVHKASASVAFGDFGTAAGAVRAIAQSGLHPANCRLLDASEAELTGAGDGSANLLILGFEAADHPVDTWMDLALAIAREHGGDPGEVRTSGDGRDAVGQWRGAFLLAPYLRDTFVACGVLSETFETAITWDRFEEFHATVMETARRAAGGQRGRRRRPRRAPRQLPLHPRLSRRGRPLLHGHRPGNPRRRGRAVGRDQGRRLRGADRGRRHDHPPPRGRPRPPPLVRPPAPSPLRRRPPRRQGGARPRGNAESRRAARPLTMRTPPLVGTLSRPAFPVGQPDTAPAPPSRDGNDHLRTAHRAG